ncbi:MAG: helix-turn-helix transcriptional regulator [Alphaproteobacteria bacterium]|nr:helix-turn-helix transcriptional regulator [Alphaproteobacteria bacterium]
MEINVDLPETRLEQRLAEQIKLLRAGRGWSLDELARQSGVSRATLSRLENAEVSATAAVLGRLAAAFGLTISRLLYLAEGDFEPLVRRTHQQQWQDPEVAFRRRSVSPPAEALSGEVLECALGPGVTIDYPMPPRRGLEHHLVLLEGRLRIEVEGRVHDLGSGDCLRYRLHGPSSFATAEDAAARYLLFVV